jgi:membrane protease YdiL (CAAX protease family)
MRDLTNRGYFLNLAAVFEGGLLVVALGLGWLLDVEPLESFAWRWADLAWGLAAAVPLVVLFLLSHRFPVGPFLPIKRFLIEMLGPSLVNCRWYDLVLLSVLVGFSEELLFRGVVQPWFANWGMFAGLVGSNILFGLAHFITPLYALTAALIGCYLGVLLNVTGNVLAPVATHAAYDFLAFLVVARAYKSERSRHSDSSVDDAGDQIG